ncbi:MAG TPA: penicillin-binding transpeptidase domain-containing protein, partial [Dehalococcoidia bacterium]|nr:penicillin-binding transpeptidase domain-containing protein [Dehalococcoidia bacterium]
AVAQRQPGSTLKPFTYLTAFEQRKLTPATMIVDEPTQFPGGRGQPPYEPQNHDKRWNGPVTVRRALSGSLNQAAVLTLHWVGLENMLNTIHRMGIQSLEYDPDRIGLAVTLGGGEVNLLELTFAYTPFAHNGRLVGQPMPEKDRRPGFTDLQPAVIRKITDSAGKTIFEYQPPEGQQVTTPEYAYQITNILSDDYSRQATYGLNSPLVINRPAGAKTGTTENFNDGWTIGYTPQMVTGVWVGNANNDPMTDVAGASGAGVIWHNFIERAHDYLKLPPEEFPRPDGLIERSVTGRHPVEPKYEVVTDLFVPGTEPPGAPPPSSPTPTPAPDQRNRVVAPTPDPCVPGWIVKVDGVPARAREIDKLYRQEVFNACDAVSTPTPQATSNALLSETPISQATPVRGTTSGAPAQSANPTLPELQPGPAPQTWPPAPPLRPQPLQPAPPLPAATPRPSESDRPAGPAAPALPQQPPPALPTLVPAQPAAPLPTLPPR